MRVVERKWVSEILILLHLPNSNLLAIRACRSKSLCFIVYWYGMQKRYTLFYENSILVTTKATQAHKPSSKSDRNLIILQVNSNGIKTNLRSSNCLFTTHMQISSQSRKPSSPIKQNLPKYITSPLCALKGCTRQRVGWSHSLASNSLGMHINSTKHITIANVYIHPRDSTSTNYKTSDTDIQHCIQHIRNIPQSVLSRDVNAHSTLWHSCTDDHNIPKGKMHSNVGILPDHIVCKITQRNNIRKTNTCDLALKLLNGEITSDIQTHKQNIWKEHLDAHWDHRHNIHTL